MKLVTLRNLPPELVRVIKRKAEEGKTSVNKTVISLLEEGVGTRIMKRKVIYHDLDSLAGSWTAKEAEAFDKALTRQRAIDPDLWK